MANKKYTSNSSDSFYNSLKTKEEINEEKEFKKRMKIKLNAVSEKSKPITHKQVIDRPLTEYSQPFSHYPTKTMFICTYCHNKNNELVNIVFGALYMSFRVFGEKNKNNNIDFLFNKFEDVIYGRSKKTVNLDFYKQNENDFTYLIHDGDKYKIGKSNNPLKRLQSLRTANPNCVLISQNPYIPEKFLHYFFKRKRIDREWFNLDEWDLNVIKSLMWCPDLESANLYMRFSANDYNTKGSLTKLNEYEKMVDDDAICANLSIPFGKYKGVKVKDMTSLEQRQYMCWFIDNIEPNFKMNRYIKAMNHELKYPKGITII